MAHAILERLRSILARFAHFYRRLRRQPRHTRRSLKARLATTLAGAALLLALSTTPAHAATITVDGTTCNLVDAITAANTDTATGGCAAGSGADVLELAAGGTFTLAATADASFNGSGTPVVTTEITINGNGATIERDATAQEFFRIFTVGRTGNLTLNDATVSGGNVDGKGGGIANYYGQLTVNDSVISSNTASGFGGGIANDEGTAVLNGTTVSNNDGSYLGGGIASGGLAFNLQTRGNGVGATLTVNDSVISGNTVLALGRFDGGGGIANVGTYGSGALLNLDGSIVDGNGMAIPNGIDGDASRPAALGPAGYGGSGGGILNISKYDSSTANITESTISGNSANEGGGLANISFKYGFAETSVVRSTISGNEAGFAGGGLVQINDTDGFYYAEAAGNTRLENSTISGNSAATYGGGAAAYNDYEGPPARSGDGGAFNELFMEFTTVTDNDAPSGGGIDSYYATVGLNGTIVSGNLAEDGPEGHAVGVAPFTDSYNLFGVDDNAGLSGLFAAGATDVVPGAGVLIGDVVYPLGDYGGDTQTHLLPTGSLAIDGVPSASCALLIDQRGEVRPALTGCDIGSVEVQAPTDVALTGVDGSANAPSALAALLATAASALGLAGWLTRRRRAPQRG